MIKVKEFKAYHCLEDKINKFIEENNIEVIDIKYSAFVDDYDTNIVCSRALLIYKDMYVKEEL